MNPRSIHTVTRNSVRRVVSIGAIAVIAGTAISSADVRSYDGTGNNIANPDWGARGQNLIRMTGVYYADGVKELSGPDRPSARHVSNVIFDQDGEGLRLAPAHEPLCHLGAVPRSRP